MKILVICSKKFYSKIEEVKKILEQKNIDLTTFNSEKDIVIRKVSGIANIKVNGHKLKKHEELNLGKIEINKDSKLIIDVTYITGRKVQFTVNTLPSSFPAYSVEGESEYEGDYYMSTYSFDYDDIHYIFKLDKNGKIKYYKKTNMVAFDFRKEKNSNGQIRYMYLEATQDNFEGTTSLLPCDLVVLDENYKEIDRINYTNQDGTDLSLENHTYIYLDDNHYILATYENRKKEIDGENLYVSDCLIEEIKDGKILWEFNSGDYPEFYKYSTKENLDYSVPYQDYIHINSMEIDKNDGNLICSFRNIDSVLKISRSNGSLIWILGGPKDEFGLSEKQKFSKQHSAISIGNNTILLYDNGNANEKSRILKIKLNPQTKTVEEYTEYDTELYANMMGSVRVIDETNQTYLICYGGGNYKKYSVEEIDYSTGETKFKFTFVFNRKMYNANKMR